MRVLLDECVDWRLSFRGGLRNLPPVIPLSVIVALDAAIHAISYLPMRRRWFYVTIHAIQKRGTRARWPRS